MRISIHAIGRMKAGPERELMGRYLGRAVAGGKSLGFTGFEVLEAPESRAGNAAVRRAEETRTLRQSIAEGAVLAVLDEGGRSLSSQGLAQLIGRWRDEGKPAAAFVIGGADGLAADLIAEAALVLSFSPLTWPHQLVRIMLAEQLYRTTTILAGHPYHRERAAKQAQLSGR